MDLACFYYLREIETALDSFAENRMPLSSTGRKQLIEMPTDETERKRNHDTSFAVPFTMTIETIVISNQDCFDGEWNALTIFGKHEKSLIPISRKFNFGKNLAWERILFRFKTRSTG